uniref:FIG001353: Acetyltransferase n=1 Tax=uncultured Thiotrichaceae bacterium TaxID=298394 RepID=A0A6S6U8M6_9GAMM|nr:MAG: FIG001353: Acetyltransferase [uncultured Thiotrichaceae bacterium]
MKLEQFDAKRHQRKTFSSGNDKLDEYLKKHLSQGVKKGLIQAYVSVDEQGKILGYYTLSAASVSHTDMPEALAKKLPRYPIPSILIGRMATDETARSQGLRVGSKLLIHALKQALVAADTIGVLCVIVDAKPEAASFYSRFGFQRLIAEDECRLYISIQTIRGLLVA